MLRTKTVNMSVAPPMIRQVTLEIGGHGHSFEVDVTCLVGHDLHIW